MDDKAYLRPGTSEGFSKVRNSRILTVSASDRARKLPKYDWPERLVYVTPSTHRVFTKNPVCINDEEKLVMDTGRHFVVIHPKAIVDSSGTIRGPTLRLQFPDDFEVDPVIVESPVYSKGFRTLCAALRDDIYLFSDMTEKDDILKVGLLKIDDKYRAYENRRIDHLEARREKAWMTKHPTLKLQKVRSLCLIVACWSTTHKKFKKNAHQDGQCGKNTKNF